MLNVPEHLGSFLVREHEGAWRYRRPAYDETAEWHGPFETYEAAHQAACDELETLLAKYVEEQLGLGNEGEE